MSTNTINQINEVSLLASGDQQTATAQSRPGFGTISSVAVNLKASADIQPSTTKAGVSGLVSIHQVTAPATTAICEIYDADAETAATVEPETEWADEEWPGLANYELIDDTEELAHNLMHSTLAPHSHPRIEALFQRAASGRGYHSQLIRASGLI